MPYFSAKDFHSYANQPALASTRRSLRVAYLPNAPLTRNSYGELVASNEALSFKESKAILREAHKRLAERQNLSGLSKWFRPWSVVPSLRTLVAPEGDFTVGVEIEMGFHSPAEAAYFGRQLIRMKHVTLDVEGGIYPIEATFPPFLYSKLSNRTQAVRYSGILAANRDKIVAHSEGARVGTHINVGCANMTQRWLYQMNEMLQRLTGGQKLRYFGRSHPYSYGYQRSRTYVEWKLFNSCTDPKRLKSYVHVGVALTKLVEQQTQPTSTQVVEALEAAFRIEYPSGTLPA